jgi:hypothetical protein
MIKDTGFRRTSFTLPVISGKTFTNQKIDLEGTRYENCIFQSCHIIYSGGAADPEGSVFSPDTKWDIRGAAANTLLLLKILGLSPDELEAEKPSDQISQ